MFSTSKNIPLPIDVSFFLSKLVPGTVLRGSPGRSLLKSWILMPFSIFVFFKRHPLEYLFALAGAQTASPLNVSASRGSYLGRPWHDLWPNMVTWRPATRFSLILDRFSMDFGPILSDFWTRVVWTIVSQHFCMLTLEGLVGLREASRIIFFENRVFRSRI